MAHETAAQIRAQLGHPVIDADGHWIESAPVFADFIRDAGGAALADEYLKGGRGNRWAQVDWAKRRNKRMVRGGWWTSPANTLDYATALMPSLMRDRLGELGIDFAIVYPTLNLATSRIGFAEKRRALCRAYNTMVAELYAPLSDRLTPAAIIPAYTVAEALEELDYAIGTLGLKVAMFRCSQPKPIPAYAKDEDSTNGVPFYVDTLGLDDAEDWDKVWQRCLDLRVAVTAHQGSPDWVDRASISNFVFNHIGHFANANHSSTKALFLGGVTRRFPNLNFAFLEGGAGYAQLLLCDLIGHWEKRSVEAMERNLKPTNLNVPELQRLMEQHAYGRLQAKGEQQIAGLRLQERTDQETECLDDYGAAGVRTKQDIVDLYTRNFYFGCEADDPATAWAFDRRMPGRLNAIFSSDVSHWDVPDMAEVLHEAWEMVEHDLITTGDFRDFTFANAVRLHGSINPDFFKGTAVEAAASGQLASASAGKAVTR